MKISDRIIWENRSGKNTSWFHPKATMINSDMLLMTVQAIKGHDYYMSLCESFSADRGVNWSAPLPIAEMGIKEIEHGIIEVISDVVPEYHKATQTVLAMGHNAYYRNGKLFDTLGLDRDEAMRLRMQRFPIYAIRDANGCWSITRRKLEVPELRDTSCYGCGCSQRVILPDGKIIIPSVIGYWNRRDMVVTSMLCNFNGKDLTFLKLGNILESSVGRGLLEPSIIEFHGKYFMTIRAEDERGYVSVSEDGLNWGKIKNWQWEDGTPLLMSTTQQHWLKIGGELYLIYTRKSQMNTELFRWRAPLFIAKFDPVKFCLEKISEQIVLPMHGNSALPETIGLMGNFHPLSISATEAIVLAGEERSEMGFAGDTLIAQLCHKENPQTFAKTHHMQKILCLKNAGAGSFSRIN